MLLYSPSESLPLFLRLPVLSIFSVWNYAICACFYECTCWDCVFSLTTGWTWAMKPWQPDSLGLPESALSISWLLSLLVLLPVNQLFRHFHLWKEKTVSEPCRLMVRNDLAALPPILHGSDSAVSPLHIAGCTFGQVLFLSTIFSRSSSHYCLSNSLV